jgi:hypothetical protein
LPPRVRDGGFEILGAGHVRQVPIVRPIHDLLDRLAHRTPSRLLHPDALLSRQLNAGTVIESLGSVTDTPRRELR